MLREITVSTVLAVLPTRSAPSSRTTIEVIRSMNKNKHTDLDDDDLDHEGINRRQFLGRLGATTLGAGAAYYGGTQYAGSPVQNGQAVVPLVAAAGGAGGGLGGDGGLTGMAAIVVLAFAAIVATRGDDS